MWLSNVVIVYPLSCQSVRHGGRGGPVERYFSGREICSLSIELPVCKAWGKGRPCGEVF